MVRLGDGGRTRGAAILFQLGEEDGYLCADGATAARDVFFIHLGAAPLKKEIGAWVIRRYCPVGHFRRALVGAARSLGAQRKPASGHLS